MPNEAAFAPRKRFVNRGEVRKREEDTPLLNTSPAREDLRRGAAARRWRRGLSDVEARLPKPMASATCQFCQKTLEIPAARVQPKISGADNRSSCLVDFTGFEKLLWH